MTEVELNNSCRNDGTQVIRVSSSRTTLRRADTDDCEEGATAERKNVSSKNCKNNSSDDLLRTEQATTDLPTKLPIEEHFRASSAAVPARPPRVPPNLDELFTASTHRLVSADTSQDLPSGSVESSVDTTEGQTSGQRRPKLKVHVNKLLASTTGRFSTLSRSVRRKISRKKIRQLDDSNSSNPPDTSHPKPDIFQGSHEPDSNPPCEDFVNEAQDKNSDTENTGKESLLVQVIEYDNSDFEED